MFATKAIIALLFILVGFSLASQNLITLKSVDGHDRSVVFTAAAGHAAIATVHVPSFATVDVSIPHGWIGNYYSVCNGSETKPGMLGEVAFNGWMDLTYFDVSAIVDPSDHMGVAQMWPASDETPTSGCEIWPCDNAYYLPDDVQTKTTTETHIITTLGNGNDTTVPADDDDKDEGEEGSAAVDRRFVTGLW